MSSLALGCSGDPVEEPGGGIEMVTPVDGDPGYVYLAGAEAMPGTLPTPSKWSLCLSCHGMVGQGFKPLAPDIRHIPVAFATQVIRNGRLDSKGMPTAMVAFPPTATPPASSLTDAEVTEILTWLNAPPKPTTADGLYRDFCGNCHGPTGPTGGSAGIKLKPGYAKAVVVSTVRNGLNTTLTPASRREYMPAFDAALLTDAELDLIAGFIGAK